MIPNGYCQCGCGRKTNKIKWSDASKGLVKGDFYRFVLGHANRIGNWRRQRSTADGRLNIYMPKHPRAKSNGYVFNHLLVAEKALGRTIPKSIPVHHVDMDKKNDSPGNLVICQDHSYHGLLHQRTSALKACGKASYVKCSICGEYDAPENIVFSKKTKYHRECRNNRRREQYKKGVPRW